MDMESSPRTEDALSRDTRQIPTVRPNSNPITSVGNDDSCTVLAGSTGVHRAPQSIDPTNTATSATTAQYRLPLPPAVLRVTGSKPGIRSDRALATSSTPQRPAADGVSVGRWQDRADSALSNVSELDSGYDELRSFTATPIVPPELVITEIQESATDVDTQPDPLQADMTTASVRNEQEQGSEQVDEEDEDDSKSMSEASDLYRSVALHVDDHCNTSSMTEREDDLLPANTGTGNSSAASPDAAERSRLGTADNDCCDLPDDSRRICTSPTDDDSASGLDKTGSEVVSREGDENGIDSSMQQEHSERGEESERSSLSPVDDDATTSRLELFQISTLIDSYEAEQTRDASHDELPIAAGGGATIGRNRDSPEPATVSSRRPDTDVEEFDDVEQTDWEASDDNSGRFRCSSALGDRAPPVEDSTEISTCEAIRWCPPYDEDCLDREIPSMPAASLGEDGWTAGPSTDGLTYQSTLETEKSRGDVVPEAGKKDEVNGGRSTDVVAADSGDVERKCRIDFQQSEEFELDFRNDAGDRLRSGRRSRRAETSVYSGKRRRRSPHPSSIYRLSVPPQQKARLWQPWHDDVTPLPVTREQGISLQTALENLRYLSVLSATDTSGGWSASGGSAASGGAASRTRGNDVSWITSQRVRAETDRCRSRSGYFRIPQDRPRGRGKIYTAPQRRFVPEQSHPPRFPTSVVRCCPLMTQFRRSPPPLPQPTCSVIDPSAQSSVDVLPNSARHRVRHCCVLSPTVDETSPQTTTAIATPVSRPQNYNVGIRSNLLLFPRVRCPTHEQYTGALQTGSNPRFVDQSLPLPPAPPHWSVYVGDSPLRGSVSTMAIQRRPPNVQWRLAANRMRHDTF